MGLSPLRLTAALVFGALVTGGLYLTQQEGGRPMPAVAAPAASPSPAARPAKPAPAGVALPVAPRRIVFRHAAPGELVLTMQGDELQVQFVAAAPAKPAVKPPPAKPAAHATAPLRPATPVATP